MLGQIAACVAVSCLGVTAANGQVRINEADSDNPSTDTLEFVELFDGGTGNTSLAGLVVVFYNGSNDLSYASFDLDGFFTNASGYFTLGNVLVPGVDITFGDNTLQNGADAVALYAGDGANFPNNTPITTANLIDALAYDTADADDAGLLVLLNAGQPQIDENSGGNPTGHSMQRCPNGSGGLRNTSTYQLLAPTPDGPNTNCPEPVGACCDTSIFSCTDAVTQVACTGANLIWTEGALCATLNPPCAAEPIGACCVDSTGTCAEGIEEVVCLSTGGRWGGDGSTCATINPPCIQPAGACCVAGFCGDGLTATTCGDIGGSYQGDFTTCNAVSCPAGPDVVINEIRIDQTSTDNDEFFELSGPAGASLQGLTYLVIGDGPGASGVIEVVVSLNGLFIPADGHFLAVEDTFTLGGSPDLVLSGVGNGLNFENSDNVTHLLVAGFLGVNGTDVDATDDCIQDAPAWVGELDRIAVIREENPPAATECHYGPPTIGPEGTFTPGLVIRCEDTIGPFVIGQFDPIGTADSPGVTNPCSVCGNGTIEGNEECDGGQCCAPNCTLIGAGTVCRLAAGDCDASETCDGISGDCPADLLVGAGTICRASQGDCDIEESCDGTSTSCPPDAVEGAGLECRPSAGDCDIAESCTGQSGDCPADVLVMAGTECRASTGDCDPAESCDGQNAGCPADALSAAGTTCRPAAGPCDAVEACDGTTVDCPADGFVTGGTCRPSVGPCDPAELCDGSGISCPADVTISSCQDGDGCCAPGCNATNDSDCTAICGNNIVEPGEQCDDGNDIDGDGCSAVCTSESIPTVSEWGMLVLALGLLIGAKLRFARRWNVA